MKENIAPYFASNTNFSLDEKGWGECNFDILKRVLGCSIDYFNGVLTNKYRHGIPYSVVHKDDTPLCSGNASEHKIHLSSEGLVWDKHTYQFAHEYCHHLINIELIGNRIGAFWFEETICELASLYCLAKNAQLWKTNPPNPGLVYYASAFSDYYNKTINRKEVPKSILSVSDFIKENILELEKPEYERGMYTYIAKGIIDIFINYPSLWNIILFFNKTNYQSEHYNGFDSFLDELESILPPEIKGYGLLKKRLLG